MLKVKIGKIEVPLYTHIINLGIDSFEKTAKRIDLIQGDEKEWEKIAILVNDLNYLRFLKKITGAADREIVKYFDEFGNDAQFRETFCPKLKIIESCLDTGDLRFHSITLYIIARAIKPEVIVETGVAFGKSSALMLLALVHNKKGRLYSIDLPNKEGNVMADGAKTSTGIYETGFLVPDYLKEKWILEIGDSVECLPKLVKKQRRIDMFLHDSLHTYDHADSELKIIYPKLRAGAVVLCDNIDKEAGKAFHDFIIKNNSLGYAYRDLGAVRIGYEKRRT